MNRDAEAIARLNSALEAVEGQMAAVECHGLLTGLLCAKGDLEERDWLEKLGADGEPAQVFAALHAETVRQMQSSMLDFQPLGPGDEAPLAERVEALGEWVQGFLLGLAEGGVNDLDKLPQDSAEIVRDFARIASAGEYEFADGEEDEGAYAELLEYVRTGVLLLNEELNPTKAPPRTDTTLH